MKIVNICRYLEKDFGYHDNIFPYYQKKKGNEVITITSTEQLHSQEVFEEGLYIEKNVKVYRLNHYFNLKPRFIKLKGIKKILMDFKPDLIISHGIMPINILTIINYKKRYKCKFVIDNHADLENSGKNLLWRKLYYNIFLKNLYKYFDKYIDKYYGVTPYRMEFLKEEIGIKKEKIGFLPQGYDNELIDSIINKITFPLDRIEFFKKNYNININEKDIIFVFGGKIDTGKHFENVIKALDELKNENIKLIIFGVINSSEVMSFVKKKSSWIYFVGWKKEKEKYELLLYSDLAIWPKYHTTLIEDCIGVGLPLLIFKNKNSEYFLEDGNGCFLENESTEEIRNKIKFIIDNKKLLEYKINAQKAKERFSYDNITKKFFNELEIIL